MRNNKRDKLSAIVLLSGVALAVIVMFLGTKIDNQIVTLVGAGLFVVAIAAGIFINGETASGGVGKASRESRSNARKYEPLLLDERTKQHPEVQRLLQYTSVQKVFFDPSYFKTSEAQNDPYVRELLAVFDNIILTQTANGVYPPLGQSGLDGTNAYSAARSREEIMRREKLKKRPRRIVGTIISCSGLALFIVPFIIAYVSSASGSESSVGIASFLFHSAPIGMVLIVIGSVIWKR